MAAKGHAGSGEGYIADRPHQFSGQGDAARLIELSVHAAVEKLTEHEIRTLTQRPNALVGAIQISLKSVVGWQDAATTAQGARPMSTLVSDLVIAREADDIPADAFVGEQPSGVAPHAAATTAIDSMPNTCPVRSVDTHRFARDGTSVDSAGDDHRLERCEWQVPDTS